MSIHRPDSQLSRVNAAAGRERGAPSTPPCSTWSSARATAPRAPAALYDPTVLPLMRLYGFYDARRGLPGCGGEIDRALALIGLAQSSSIDRKAGTLGARRARAPRSTSARSARAGRSIARSPRSARAGVRSGLVDVGGNVYGLGIARATAAEGWSVGVFHPVTGAARATLRAARRGGRDQRQHRADAHARRRARRAPVRRAARPPGERPPQRERRGARRASTRTRVSTVAFLLGPGRCPRLPRRPRPPLRRAEAMRMPRRPAHVRPRRDPSRTRTRRRRARAADRATLPPPDRGVAAADPAPRRAGDADREEGRPGRRGQKIAEGGGDRRAAPRHHQRAR